MQPITATLICAFFFLGASVPQMWCTTTVHRTESRSAAPTLKKKIVEPGECTGVVFQSLDRRLWIAGSGVSCPIKALDVRSGLQTSFSRYASEGRSTTDQNTPSSQPNDPNILMGVSSIAESTEDGKIWFCSSDYSSGPGVSAARTLTSYDGKRWITKPLDPCPSGDCTAGLFQGPGGSLWSWSGNALRRYSNGSWSAPIVVSDELAGQKPPPPEPASSEPASSEPAEPITPEPENSGGVRLPVVEYKALPADPDAKPNYTITAAIQGNDRQLWIATNAAVITCDRNAHNFRVLSWNEGRHADVIYEDSADDLWFGNHLDAKVDRFVRRSGSWKTYDLFDHITDVKEYLLGLGLVSGPAWDHLSDKLSASVRRMIGVTSIGQDSQGALVFGLSGGPGGLVVLDSIGRWRRYGIRELGLDFKDVKGIILTSEGDLLVSTGSGLISLEL